ncbi:hypothetical protein BVRB_037800, partial [Beta vulgaris subsp. vulgaris]
QNLISVAMTEVKKPRRGGKRSKKSAPTPEPVVEAPVHTDVLDAVAALEDNEPSSESAEREPAAAAVEDDAQSKKRRRDDADEQEGEPSDAGEAEAAVSSTPVELALNYDFESLDLSEPTRKALQEIGYERMTE